MDGWIDRLIDNTCLFLIGGELQTYYRVLNGQIDIFVDRQIDNTYIFLIGGELQTYYRILNRQIDIFVDRLIDNTCLFLIGGELQTYYRILNRQIDRYLSISYWWRTEERLKNTQCRKWTLKHKNIQGYSPFRGNASYGAFSRIFTVVFLVFLSPAGGSNPAWPIA